MRLCRNHLLSARKDEKALKTTRISQVTFFRRSWVRIMRSKKQSSFSSTNTAQAACLQLNQQNALRELQFCVPQTVLETLLLPRREVDVARSSPWCLGNSFPHISRLPVLRAGTVYHPQWPASYPSVSGPGNLRAQSTKHFEVLCRSPRQLLSEGVT